MASGDSQTDAWLKAGYKVTRDVARRNAAESLTKPDIIVRVAELRALQTAATQLTKAEKHELLGQIARSTIAASGDRIRAMAEDSKMAGHYEPERHVFDAGERTLDAVRERAASMSFPFARIPAITPDGT